MTAGTAFVCSLEPYHDNGTLIAVCGSLEDALRVFADVPRDHWREGDTGTGVMAVLEPPSGELRVWYAGTSDLMPMITEVVRR